MILFRKMILTVTALTVLLQLSCSPVFAEDTGGTIKASTDHPTRERVRVRVRVRREVHERSDSTAKASEKTTSIDRDTTSSERRDDARDLVSDRNEMKRESNLDQGREKKTSSGHEGNDANVVSERLHALASENDDSKSKKRRLVKRLVRVNLRTIGRNVTQSDSSSNGANIDTNNQVASINPHVKLQNWQSVPKDSLAHRSEDQGGSGGGEDYGSGISNPPDPRTNCAKRLTKNCVTKRSNDGPTGLPSKPRYKTDQDEALAAVENGTIMPWKEALKQLSRHVSGKIIGVRMNQTSDRSVYQVKVRTPEGEIKSILVDAATGQILQTQGY